MTFTTAFVVTVVVSKFVVCAAGVAVAVPTAEIVMAAVLFVVADPGTIRAATNLNISPEAIAAVEVIGVLLSGMPSPLYRRRERDCSGRNYRHSHCSPH